MSGTVGAAAGRVKMTAGPFRIPAPPANPKPAKGFPVTAGRLAAGTGEGRVPACRASLVGTVHGLAGSAAVALLVLSSVRDARAGTVDLLVFGLGTSLGMALVTTSMAAPVGLAARRWRGLPRIARLATGTLSLGFGLWLMWSIGWQDGLFRAVPRWNPH